MGIAKAKTVLNAEPDFKDADWRVAVSATGKFWQLDNQMVTSASQKAEASTFRLERQVDGSYKIKVDADGQYLHVNGLGDQLLSTRYQTNDDYSKFFLEGPDAADGLY